MILGITGCPGSGKSIVAGVMAQHGWVLVDADEIGHEVVDRHPDVLMELADSFGSEIMDVHGKLNRRELSRRAFAKPEKIQILNSIVHPGLIKHLQGKVEEIRSKNLNGVVDCALIFEWGIEKLFDFVVCVSSDEHLRKKRLMDRDGRSSEEIEGMFSAQLPECEKVRKADIVITNHNSVERIILLGAMLAELSRIVRNEQLA